MVDQAATRPGPRPVDASPEGWRELANQVRLAIAHRTQCDSIDEFVEVTGFPKRTLERVLACEGVGFNTLLKLETTFRWKPGTAMKYLQGPPIDENPVPQNADEEEFWQAMKRLTILKPRERAEYFHMFRNNRKDQDGSEEQSG